MILINEANDYIRNIIKCVTKSEFVKAAIVYSNLYLFTLNGIIYTVSLNNKIDNNIIMGFDSDTLKCEEYISNNEAILLEVINKVKELSNKIPSAIYHNDNLRADIDFEQMINAKADEGSFRYNIITNHGYKTFIVLYRGIFNLNKDDSIGMDLYESDGANILIAHFFIHKKKINTNYCIDFKFLNYPILYPV